jgi:hypothetical protein
MAPKLAPWGPLPLGRAYGSGGPVVIAPGAALSYCAWCGSELGRVLAMIAACLFRIKRVMACGSEAGAWFSLGRRLGRC